MRTLFVAGTAGHIDHGKSALVKALTGIDPDRLEEEKRRGMTIDLGFAHFDLPSGRRVGIVDVPGHERLVKNMLAGATGIDLVLLVIAADEGVMPQTREHLDILRFLPLRQGIVVLNKVDLVGDASWLTLVREDVKALVTGTFLEGAPVVELSAKTGQGVPALIEEMDRMLDHLPGFQDDAPARLPIDRVFTMAGFGTVVTGTLWSGRIALGDTLELLPRGRAVRVRGVQSHGQAVSAGIAGSRVAVNLTGVEKDEVGRGDVLSTPGAFRPTNLIDVRVRLLPASPMLLHLARTRIYIGSDEAIGRLVLLDRSRIEPADSATAQIRLEKPIVAAAGDAFVIRRYSPMTTIGGGEVVNAHPPRRRRGADSAVAIEHISAAGLPERLAAAVQDAGKRGTTIEEMMEQLSVGRAPLDAALPALGNRGQVLMIRGRLFHRHAADVIGEAVVREVEARHEAEPWRVGIPKEELKAKAFGTGDNHLYAHVMSELIAAGKVDETRDFVRRPGYTPPVDPKLAGARDRILRVLLEGRFAPPSVDEIAKAVDEGAAFDRLFRTLRDEGLVVEIGSGVFFHRDVLEEIKRVVVDEIRKQGNITVAALRDKLSTSRKYSLAVLEYLDSIKMTRRVGDARVLLARAAASERT
jgi:selenocysteine-specific elongation factor